MIEPGPSFNSSLCRSLIMMAIGHGLTIEQFRDMATATGLIPAASPDVMGTPGPGEVATAQASNIDEFAAALREASCSLASLPLDVLAHVRVEDWKSAFVAWFEGRDGFADEDWLTLLNLLRELMPNLFGVKEAIDATGAVSGGGGPGAFLRPVPEGWGVSSSSNPVKGENIFWRVFCALFGRRAST